jgi:hypothetical protein
MGRVCNIEGSEMGTFRCYNVALAQAKDWAIKYMTSMYVIRCNGYYTVVAEHEAHPNVLAFADASGAVFEAKR